MVVRWIAGHLEEVLGTTLLAGMAFLALANVVTRYIFHYPLAFTEELEINALVWLTLFGTSLAFKRGHHLRMLFFQDKLPQKIRFWLNQVVNLAGIGLFSSLGYLGYLQLMDERVLEITSESLNLPQWLYTSCIPVGCALIVVRICQVSISELRGSR
ncbi:MAG: TRAP transporter small permease [Desulfobulbus sp.]|nr:TRAP transporter small permease [Desulfobulbus sp.]